MDGARIAADLRRMRELAGLDRAQLGEKLNVGSMTIERLEDGDRVPSNELIEAWAAACGRSVELHFPMVATNDGQRMRHDLDVAWEGLSLDDQDLVARFAKALGKAASGWKELQAAQIDAVVPSTRPRSRPAAEPEPEPERWRRARDYRPPSDDKDDLLARLRRR